MDTLLTLETNIRNHVYQLAGLIGERSTASPDHLALAADYIEQQFVAYGYQPESHYFGSNSQRFRNIVATRSGLGPTIVVGAHYDTVAGSPGADDNASGVATLLELARLAPEWAPGSPVIFAGFSNEECADPADMGSAFFALELQQSQVQVKAMVSLEMLGYYDNAPASQTYPALMKFFYPSTANFIALVSNYRSRRLLKTLRSLLQRMKMVDIKSAVLPAFFGGTNRSDHASFWAQGIPAIMVTDTSFYRNPNYHKSSDTPETLDYVTLARLTLALSDSLNQFAASSSVVTPSPRKRPTRSLFFIK
jgi:Zn-dependent M28 family amino/carboxypeptidase